MSEATDSDSTQSKHVRSSSRYSRARPAIALLLVGALALVIRSLGFEWVFVEGDVYFSPADTQYHLRRALWGFANFPSVLLFDPYINYPGGAAVAWPPLYDWVLALATKLLASDLHGFERVVAWAGPVFGTLTIVPVYFIGRQVAGRGTGVLASFIFALLPISVDYSRLGVSDHHSAVGMVGAWLLYAVVSLVRSDRSSKGMRRSMVALGLARLGLLLTWHGSLLYLVVVEGILLLVFIGSGRREILRAQWLSALGVLCVLIPIRLALPMPLGGAYSAIALSWLHVLAVGAVVFVAGGLFEASRRGLVESVSFRLLGIVGLAAFYFGVVLLMPGPTDGLTPAITFLTMTDGIGHTTNEQNPLFALFGRETVRPATRSWGYLAYLIPLTPLIALWRWRQARAGVTPGQAQAALALALWALFFGCLAIMQTRYGNDFAPAASVLFALGLVMGSTLVAGSGERGLRQPVVIAVLPPVLALLLLGPALGGIYLPRARGSAQALSKPGWLVVRRVNSLEATLSRFTRAIRRATPETAGFLEAGGTPEYGIIAHPNIGHAIQYGARRATATDPFWAFIGPQNWNRTASFLAARDEQQAVALAKQLQARYVVTTPDVEAESVSGRMHFHDGSMHEGLAALEHFRLIFEMHPAGRSIVYMFVEQTRRQIPYKLFERVEGARLEVAAPPHEFVVVTVEVVSNRKRSFLYRNVAVADADGIARMTLPYSPQGTTPTRAVQPYRVKMLGRVLSLDVSEEDVVEGRRIRLDSGFSAR